MKYFVIGDEDTVLGFQLAGITGEVVKNQDEVNSIFTSVLANPEIGIVVITEKSADLIRARLENYIFTKDFPLILEIPDRNGVDSKRPSLKQMVNAAIGIKL